VVAVEHDAHTILRLLPHGVLVVAPDWRVLYANPEADRMIGSTGATLWERCPELEHTAFASGFRYAMSDKTELLTESALPTVGWCQARARPTPTGGLLISLRQVHAGTIETGQAKQALLIGEIGDALTREESLDKALERSAKAIIRNLDAAVARIWIVDEPGHELILGASAGLDLEAPRKLMIGETKIGEIADEGTPYLTNEVETDVHVGHTLWAKRERLQSFAGYPLRIEDRIVGVMAMYSRKLIDHDLLNSLSSVADALALGIERKRAAAGRRLAEDALRVQAEQLEVLHELGKQLAAELDVDLLVQKITGAAKRLAGADSAALFYNLRGKQFASFGAAGLGPMLPKVLGRVIRIGDVAETPYAGLPCTSFLGVPVLTRGRVVGALLLGHERADAFGENVEQMILGVAAQAAIAIDNARLFKDAHELIAALEKSNRELDQFAYVASHDLKAPLRGIANLAQWIEDDLGPSLTPDSRNHLELLRGRVVRLEYLIAGILAYSRAARDGSGAEEAVELGALVRETWELLAPPATAKLVVVGDLPTLHGSRTQLQQLVMNLVGNAIKYNRERDLTIEVGATHREGVYEVFVRDDGVGIAPEYHDKVWGLFQTLERRDKVESTGIGLSIVRKIVEARGGRTWVASTPGQGAAFYFTWPEGDEHG
jgi:signal transduction histidine kinase